MCLYVCMRPSAQGLVNKLTDYGVPEGNILGIRYGFKGFYDKVRGCGRVLGGTPICCHCVLPPAHRTWQHHGITAVVHCLSSSMA